MGATGPPGTRGEDVRKQEQLLIYVKISYFIYVYLSRGFLCIYSICCYLSQKQLYLEEACCSKIFLFSVVIFQGDQGPVGRRGRNGGDGSVVSARLRIHRASS